MLPILGSLSTQKRKGGAPHFRFELYFAIGKNNFANIFLHSLRRDDEDFFGAVCF